MSDITTELKDTLVAHTNTGTKSLQSLVQLWNLLSYLHQTYKGEDFATITKQVLATILTQLELLANSTNHQALTIDKLVVAGQPTDAAVPDGL